MEGTIYSIIPALIMLILVLLTKRVLLSLGVGIVVGALFIHDFRLWGSMNGDSTFLNAIVYSDGAISEIWTSFYTIFYTDGAVNIGNIYLLLFLLLLGVMTAFLQSSGGSRAFGEWMLQHIRTRRGASLMTGVLGIIIFIDDYFNSLAVGQIARPLTDRHQISRAKLAYFIDSTSAPITVISPISSWGAYIIGTLGALFAANGITDLEPFSAFVQMIPLNMYAIAAIILVFMVATLNLDIGAMKKHEDRAKDSGDLVDPENSQVPGDLSDTFTPHTSGKIYHLIIPILVLVVATVAAMIITGMNASEGSATLLSTFANTNVNLSLFIGGVTAVIVAAIFHFILGKPKANIVKILIEGCKTMLPAIYILILAWMIGSIIGTLETGTYLANVVNNASVDAAFLPAIFFIIAGIMAVATGTSWGTFGIMLPIAAEVAVVTDMEMLLPTLAAVLAGAVFGDHCTPISDTTILSSTGAGANHIDHVMTQLPYAMLAALTAFIGYLVVGLTSSVILSFALTVVLVIVIGFVIHVRNSRK